MEWISQIKPIFGTPINRSHPLAVGLVAHYTMNEGMGDLVHDSVGMNDGKMISMFPFSGTSGWVPGPQGAALAFDGSNDYVNAGNGARLRNFHIGANGVMTILAWIKLNNLISQQSIYSRYENSNNLREFSFSVLPTTGKLRLYVTDLLGNNAYGVTTDSGLTTDVWKYVSVTYANSLSGATNKIKIYVDGVLVSRSQTDVSGTFTAMSDGNQPSLIGSLNVPALVALFNGLISSVSIYNRALSVEEIAYLYAFPWCMYEAGAGVWTKKDYGREARLANYYQQMRAA